MKGSQRTRRRPAVQITDGRASRLHHLVAMLAERPRRREELLALLKIGLRTFYRELELLKRCGVKIRLSKKTYVLQGTLEEAEERLPFPDPRLSFAEIAELARGKGPAAQRMAEMLEKVLSKSVGTPAKKKKGRAKSSRK